MHSLKRYWLAAVRVADRDSIESFHYAVDSFLIHKDETHERDHEQYCADSEHKQS